MYMEGNYQSFLTLQGVVNIHKYYVLSTQCSYVFRVDLRTKNHHFPIQH